MQTVKNKLPGKNNGAMYAVPINNEESEKYFVGLTNKNVPNKMFHICEWDSECSRTLFIWVLFSHGYLGKKKSMELEGQFCEYCCLAIKGDRKSRGNSA